MALTTAAQSILRKHALTQAGELPPAFWSLIERYRSELVNQAFSILGNPADAEDVAQETLCEAYLHHEDLSAVRSLGAWLRQVNRANALDCLRARKRDQGRTERKKQLEPPRHATTGGFSMLELREFLARSIESLPDELREVVVLRYWEHLSYDQIAHRLDVPAISVRRRLAEAYLRLYRKSELEPVFQQANTEQESR